MNLTDLHRRLHVDALAVGGAYPLALTDGYAVQAHGLVDRLSQDLDVATENRDRMEEQVKGVADQVPAPAVDLLGAIKAPGAGADNRVGLDRLASPRLSSHPDTCSNGRIRCHSASARFES